MTKFINGTSDCVAGCVVPSHDFVTPSTTSTAAPSMLLGPVLDCLRAASILKNLHSLHIRMEQHSRNAHVRRRAACRDWGSGCTTPDWRAHPQHELMSRLMNPGYGYGGMLVVDAGDPGQAPSSSWRGCSRSRWATWR